MAVESRRWRWVLLGVSLVVAAALTIGWLVPRRVSADRAAARDRLAGRLEAMALELDGDGGELGACLLGLGEPEPAPGDSAVPELRSDYARDWVCEEMAYEQWPLFGSSLPVERCDDAATARWHRDPEPFFAIDRELVRRLALALREPDPDERLRAARGALRMLVATHRIIAMADFAPFGFAPLEAATWLGAADPEARRALAAELRQWAGELPDDRFLLAAMTQREDGLWRPVEWRDVPFDDGTEARDAVEGPFGLLGADPRPFASPGPLHRAFDESRSGAARATPVRQASVLLMAALLLEGDPAEESLFDRSLVVERSGEGLCVYEERDRPVCVRPEWKNARRIAIDRAIQSYARDTLGERWASRVALLPEGELHAPVTVETRTGAPSELFEGSAGPLEVIARWTEEGDPRRCALRIGPMAGERLFRAFLEGDEPTAGGDGSAE